MSDAAATATVATPAAGTPPAAAVPTALGSESKAAAPAAANTAAAATAATQKEAPAGTGTEAKAQESAADELAIKLPEGVTPDTLLLNEFKPLAKELGLKTEGAQRLVDLFQRAQASWAEKAQGRWAETQKAMVEQAKADKEYGGANFEKANLPIALKAVGKYGTPELKQFLNESGLGNHPELIRFCYRIGKAMAEDSVAGTTTQPSEERSQEEILARMYPTMKSAR